MIPAPPGLVALYTYDNPRHRIGHAVIAFDDDARPLVIDEGGKHDKTRLVPASTWHNYDGLGPDPDPPVSALLPAGGWRIEYTHDDGTVSSEPLVGWGLKDGTVVGLVTDCEGCVMDLDLIGDKYRIYHPDADVPATGGASRKEGSDVVTN